MEISENKIIGELVAEDYRTASVFKSYGIDFCCNGNRSIGQVCEANKIEQSDIISKLEGALQNSDNSTTDYKSWPLDLLADYIEKKHHRYAETKIPEIKSYLNKIVNVHGRQHPELVEIETLFLQSAGELSMHMKKEELILFPYIRKMVQAEQHNDKPVKPHFGTIENPVAMMKHDHDTEGDRFRKIAALSNQYTLPMGACNTYRVAFALLKEFEDDLHLHIHLENNILFPKAIDLEKSFQ